jgi:acetolactate decarboxylase
MKQIYSGRYNILTMLHFGFSSSFLKRKIVGLLLAAFIMSCGQNENNLRLTRSTTEEYEDTFYQYSIWWAFVNKCYDGTLTAKALKTKGDIALGSYSALDGELVMADGVPYKITEDGVVSEADDEELIVYVDAAFFNPAQSFTIDSVVTHESLRTAINNQLPTKNVFYAFKIRGDFSYVKCGGLHKQERPYETGLDVLIPNRPVFERENLSGTIIGFYCPEFIGNINVANYHFHFISDDKKFGGHLMEFHGKNLKVEIDPLHKYKFELPQTEDFLNGKFDKEFQYNNK